VLLRIPKNFVKCGFHAGGPICSRVHVAELFHDRAAAGRAVAEKLQQYRDRADTIVLALPRGGVPVGFEIARELHAPLDVFLVRKLGVPGQEELGFGAIASGDTTVFDRQLIADVSLFEDEIERIVAREKRELARRQEAYRAGLPPLDVRGRIAILVDDGLATGATMLAAVRAVRGMGPRKIVVAVPVSAPQTCERLRHEADEAVCLETPQPFWSVGLWYENFTQTTDEEVRSLLAQARAGLVEGDRHPVAGRKEV
jgi:putative phosphoribosyl transferase